MHSPDQDSTLIEVLKCISIFNNHIKALKKTTPNKGGKMMKLNDDSIINTYIT